MLCSSVFVSMYLWLANRSMLCATPAPITPTCLLFAVVMSRVWALEFLAGCRHSHSILSKVQKWNECVCLLGSASVANAHCTLLVELNQLAALQRCVSIECMQGRWRFKGIASSIASKLMVGCKQDCSASVDWHGHNGVL